MTDTWPLDYLTLSKFISYELAQEDGIISDLKFNNLNTNQAVVNYTTAFSYELLHKKLHKYAVELQLEFDYRDRIYYDKQ